MTGAPFWGLGDFADAVPEEARGRMGAELQGAGRWGGGGGHTGAAEGPDFLAEAAALPPVRGWSLADVLVPVPHADVPAESVRRLLATVAFAEHLPPEHPAAFGADGSWRLGNLYGTLHKDQPAPPGARARNAAREERIRQL